jgi:hypothetical protein
VIVKSVNVESGPGTSTTGGYGVLPGFSDAATPAPGAYPPGYNPEARYGGEMRGMPPGAAPITAPPVTRGGLQTVLDEKPLKVTLVLNVVRLLPKK